MQGWLIWECHLFFIPICFFFFDVAASQPLPFKELNCGAGTSFRYQPEVLKVFHWVSKLKLVKCFPGVSVVKKSACQCRRRRFNPWVGKIPLEEGMVTHSSIIAWETPWTEKPGSPYSPFHSPWNHKELDMTQQLNNSNKSWLRRGQKIPGALVIGESVLWFMWASRDFCDLSFWPSHWASSFSSCSWVWFKAKPPNTLMLSFLSIHNHPFSSFWIITNMCGLKYHLWNIHYLILRNWGLMEFDWLGQCSLSVDGKDRSKPTA